MAFGYADALQFAPRADSRRALPAVRAVVAAGLRCVGVPFPNDDLCAANLARCGAEPPRSRSHTVEHLRALNFGSPDATALTGRCASCCSARRPAERSSATKACMGSPADAAYEYCSLTELLFSLARLAQAPAVPWLRRLDGAARLQCGAGGPGLPNGRAISYLCSDHACRCACFTSGQLLAAERTPWSFQAVAHA